MMKKLILISLIFFGTFLSCKEQPAQANVIVEEINDTITTTVSCKIPDAVLSYLNKNKSKWEMLDPTDFNTLGAGGDCPMKAVGDFNQDNKQDLALVVKNKSYRPKGGADIDTAFLLLFEDYKNFEDNPKLITKTGPYKKDYNISVINDQYEKGIWSYVETTTIDNKDVIQIVIPEKSTFIVEWVPSEKAYLYRNILDQPFEKVSKIATQGTTDLSALYGTWKLDCTSSNRLKIDVIGGQLMIPGQFLINTSIRKVTTGSYEVYFKSPPIRPIGEIMVDYKSFSTEKPIAEITEQDGQLRVRWKGFYLTTKKQMILTENPFDKDASTLVKCN